MIIRSQDKRMIINFNGASNIYMQGTSIWANTYHGIATLGIYSTEEKAIKVLDMIQSAYVCSKGGTKYFQMPQNSEV